MNQEKSYYQIVYAPNDIFKKQAEHVEVIDDSVRAIVDKMLNTMHIERAVGLGANMVGVLKRIAVVDLHENNKSSPIIFINPEITYFSNEKQTFTERSLSFRGIEAPVTRSKTIKINYLDYQGNKQELEAEGFLATVIQHEVDYLNGKVFLEKRYTNTTEVNYYDNNLKIGINYKGLYNLERTYTNINEIKIAELKSISNGLVNVLRENSSNRIYDKVGEYFKKNR